MLREDLPAPRWLWDAPALVALGILVGFLTADWGAQTGALVAVVALGTVFVGFNKEIALRGLAIV